MYLLNKLQILLPLLLTIVCCFGSVSALFGQVWLRYKDSGFVVKGYLKLTGHFRLHSAVGNGNIAKRIRHKLLLRPYIFTR